MQSFGDINKFDDAQTPFAALIFGDEGLRRIAEINVQLEGKFPDYAAFESPVPLAVWDVQAQLGAVEALVLFLNTPEWKPMRKRPSSGW